jgi:hypothetical protein
MRLHRPGRGPPESAAASARRFPDAPPYARGSTGNDRGGERDPMVLGPRRSQRSPRSVEHIAGSLTELSGRLRLDVLRVEEVNLPAAHVSTFREHLAVHPDFYHDHGISAGTAS